MVAIGPIMLGLAANAGAKGYAPGPGLLCHLSNDDEERAAVLCRFRKGTD